MRLLLKVIGISVVLALLLVIRGHLNATADPIVRRATIMLAHWPAGTPPVRLVLISDVHIGNSVMDPARLERIVRQIDGLKPDLVLMAGDFAAGRDSVQAGGAVSRMAMPLSHLKAPLGVFATLGNHDEWADPKLVAATLARAGVTVLDNQAVRRGPLIIGGIGDSVTGHQSVPKTAAAMAKLRGAHIVFTHSPDLARKLPPDMPLLLAGHTHCGQVVLPFYGPVAEVSSPRYRCGIVRENGRIIVVTAGLGASVVPLRFGAPPDLWLLTLGPPRRG